MDLARELSLIQDKGYGFFEEHLGEAVYWCEFDAVNSQFNKVYDEAGRRWKDPILVPALWVNVPEGTKDVSPDGRRVVPSIALAVPVATLRQTGLSNVEDAGRHLNDLLFYDNTWWEIGSYQVRGRLRQKSVIVGVQGTKFFPDEDAVFDVLPFRDADRATRRPLGVPNEEEPEFPEHDDEAFTALFPDHPVPEDEEDPDPGP
jgi:hypothetical protein